LEGAIDDGEIALAEFMQDTGYLPAGSFDEAPEPEGDASEPPASGSGRIRDAILPQIRSQLAEEDVPIAELIIDNLDEDGFLSAFPVELAQSLGVSEERVETVRAFIRHLEGGGIAALNLREALLCQLEVIGFDPASVEYRIVSLGCDLMLRRRFSELALQLESTEERIHEAMIHICQLDPRPGARFTGENPAFVQPDFCVEWVGDTLSFYPIDSWVPRLRLSAKYRELLAHPRGVPRDELVFARLKFQKALMLLKGIESRRQTLAGVMGHIVRKQQRFFSHGREFLKPMSIKDAAGALNTSASTISRAVQGKYVETTFGILPMRSFFSTGTDGVARRSVKDKVRRLIEDEDKRRPLSDGMIVKALAKNGIRLSRRVVVKYRREMGISCAAERKA